MPCHAPKNAFPVPFPENGDIYDYHFVKEGFGKWIKWQESLVNVPAIPDDALFNNIIIPTVDTVRYMYLMDMLVKHEKPCLFVGHTGTGKSVYIQVNNWVRYSFSYCKMST